MPATKNTGTFSDFEVAAMKARAKELKAEARASKNRADGEKLILDAIAQMSDADKAIAKIVHELVTKTAPELFPKTWYGMPAYADKEGSVVCFFQAASKFKSRYSTLGFSDPAKLDDGNMWPTAFALVGISKSEEDQIVELVKQAIK